MNGQLSRAYSFYESADSPGLEHLGHGEKWTAPHLSLPWLSGVPLVCVYILFQNMESSTGWSVDETECCALLDLTEWTEI